jgi:hypothetical protein
MTPASSMRVLLLVLACMAVAGCASGGGRVSTLAGPDFSLAQGQRWAWQSPLAAGREAPTDPRVDNDIVRGALEHAVAGAMAGRGFERAQNPADAGYLIAIRVGLRTRSETREVPSPWIPRQRVVCGPRGCIPVLDVWGLHGPPPPATRTVEYLEGGVMLDIIDAGSGQLVWRGTIEDRVQPGRMPPQATIDAAIRGLVERIPTAD